MAKYRVLATSFINNALLEPGAIVDYDGEASSNLELIEDDAPKAKAKGKAKASDAAAPEASTGDGTDLV